MSGDPPSALQNVTIDTTVGGSLTVSWDTPSNLTEYCIVVLYGTNDVSNPTNYSPGIYAPDTSFTYLLPAGTYGIRVDQYGPSGSYTAGTDYMNISLGGGGGGGGGGNNGGNGYNNMAELEYNYPSWISNVTQDNTITVLGEDSAAITVDETIVINVPLAKLKECVVYDSNWTLLTGEAAGEQPLPKVEFRPSESYAAGSEMTAMFAQLKAKGTGTVGDRTFADDAAGTHDQFGKRLINDVTFTGSVLESNDLPKVAIRSIAEGDITVDELTTTVAKVDTETAASHKSYLEGLFEQLVAADRIKGDDAAGTAAGFGACKMPSLQAGDSISFKVTYNFSKTRTYEVDGLDAGNGNTSNKALTLTIAGQSFTIQVGADGQETSDAYSRSYAFKLVATA